MKAKLLLTITFLWFLTTCFGQQNATWDKWDWLMGEWKGEGSGQPGQGGGTFSFKPDLDNKILVRKSHSEYPATENKPKVIHDDLLLVYLVPLRKRLFFQNRIFFKQSFKRFFGGTE